MLQKIRKNFSINFAILENFFGFYYGALGNICQAMPKKKHEILRGLFCTNDDKKILSCFWIFFFFLMTEGIFRRWLLPSMNNLFLVVRDPFVLYAVIIGFKRQYIKNFFSYSFILLGITTFFVTMLAGHGNAVVALYGVRISVLYFPFMYVVGRVLTMDDVLKIGSILVKLIVPMVMLNILQFFSPQSSFVNIGVGGNEEGAGFSGVMGYFRPPGIFTFIAALTDYYAIALCFLLYFMYDNKAALRYGISISYLYLTVLAFIISMFITISRTHFISTLGIVAAAMPAFKNMKGKLVGAAIAVVVSFTLLSTFDEFNLFLEVFFTRFDGANDSEGGFGNSLHNRLFGYLERAMNSSVPLSGYGEGTFTNFGIKYLFGDLDIGGNWGKRFSDAEFEWARLIMEDGPILGSIYVILRIIMGVTLFIYGLKALRCGKNPLVWFLTPYAVLMVAQLQLKTSYHLGFMCVLVASCIALDENKIKHSKI